MDNVQIGILAPLPRFSRYLTFDLKFGAAPRQALQSLRDLADSNKMVVGLGYPVALAMERSIPSPKPGHGTRTATKVISGT